MKMTNKEKARRRRQKALNQEVACIVIVNLLIVFAIMLAAVVKSAEVSGNNESEGESNFAVYESELNDHNAVTSPANASNVTTAPMEEIVEEVEEEIATEVQDTTEIFSRNLSEEDKYLLAKIAMAEAEGESIETKMFVILTVLNRVYSENRYFPDTVKEVIFQNNGSTYQFSPVMPNGRWWRVEPNEDCWVAVELVNAMEEDISKGALYFESCKGESWHSRNLEFLFESNGMRFYK